jgi:hypothetical protein
VLPFLDPKVRPVSAGEATSLTHQQAEIRDLLPLWYGLNRINSL